MQDSTRPCAHCGDQFEPKGRRNGSQSTYCHPCHRGYVDAYRAGRHAEWHASRTVTCRCGTRLERGRERHCEKCSTTSQTPARMFTCARNSCHNVCISPYPQTKFCSDSCRNYVKTMAKVARIERRCPCGVTFMVKAPSTRKIHCSHACSKASPLGPFLESWPMFGPIKPPSRMDRPCMDCGEMMPDAMSIRKRCDECGRLRNIDRSMRLYETAYSTGKVKRAMHWRYKLVEYLRERDGDKCALCSGLMLFGVTTGPRGESDQGATIDHILPRSLDGSNELANLQLAHWSCNRAKGNRVGVQQLRLVG